jgi:hypothetical protein
MKHPGFRVFWPSRFFLLNRRKITPGLFPVRELPLNAPSFPCGAKLLTFSEFAPEAPLGKRFVTPN